MPEPKIIIVGGGIGGLAVASGLLGAGVPCRVYERDDPQVLLRQGYHIRISQWGVDALKQLVSPSVYKQLQGKFSPHAAPSPVLCDPHTLEPLVFLDAYKVYPHSKPLSRFSLRQALVQRVEREHKAITYNKRFSKLEIVDVNGKEQVKVHFQDGSYETADILVAADGSRSKIREQAGLPESEVLPLLNIHYKAALTDAVKARLPRILREEKVMGVAAHGFINFFALYHAPTAEELTFDGVKGEDGDAPVGDAQECLYFSLACPQAKIAPYDPSKPPAYYYEKLHNYLTDHPDLFNPGIREILELCKNDLDHLSVSTFRCSRKPPSGWRKPGGPREHGNARVFFVGDSMHSMPPGRGMGANTALADAQELVPYLVQLVKDNGDQRAIEQANLAYEKHMLPRAFGWVEASMQAFNLDTESWGGFIGLRIFRSVLTVGHYLQSIGETLRLRNSMGFHF